MNVAVFQMGKVGSSTIARAIEAPQVHTLDAKTWLSSAWPRPYRHHLNSLRMALRRPRMIVSGVREPVARNLSAFMQNAGPKRWAEDAAAFFKHYPHMRPLEWFDREMRRHVGIDVFAHPFPHEQGWQIIDGQLLILRAEAPDEAKEEALSLFLGRRVSLGARRNVSAEKDYAAAYAALKSSIQVPSWYLDMMYGSRYARHFYTASEIEGFRAFWSAGE